MFHQSRVYEVAMTCSLCVYGIQFVLILGYCDELVTKSMFS